MITRTDKQAIIDGLKADIAGAKAVFLTNLIGVTSNDSVEIRKNIREVDGKIKVTRNTLFEKAAIGTPAEELLSGLKGPHAVAFAYEDAAAVAKCLKDANKEHEEVVELKGGLLDGKTLSKAEFLELASLPSKDVMLGTLLATFNAPISALARVIYAIQEQKESGAEPAPAEEAAPVEAAPATEGEDA